MAFNDPDVVAVLDAYRACADPASGAVPALLLPMDPPAVVWTGLLHYVASLEAIRENDRQLEESKNGRTA